MATIAKNTKKAAEIFETATRCVSYSLYNGFSGDECDPKYAREALARGLRAKMQANGRGGYTVHVHSNQWYELTV